MGHSDSSSVDRIVMATLSGICARYCSRGVIDDKDRPLAELQALGRPDLLTVHAGVALGFAQSCLDVLTPRYRAEAELCLLAGADEEKLGPWIEEGCRRGELANEAKAPLGRIREGPASAPG